MKVYIMRGVSGSGKSTYVKNNLSNAVICSADHYLINEQGEYKFDTKLLGPAHKNCFRKFLEAIQNKEETIVIDNTNALAWEISPYYLAAETFGYDVEIIEMQVELEIAAARNIHGLSEKIIKGKMYAMKQYLPRMWKVKKIK